VRSNFFLNLAIKYTRNILYLIFQQILILQSISIIIFQYCLFANPST